MSLNKWSTTDDVLAHVSGSGTGADHASLLEDCSVLVTGASSGIGRETARVLASLGATVLLACRSPTRAAAAVTELVTADSSLGSRLHVLQLDLADPASVTACAAAVVQQSRDKQWPPLRTLVLNGGVYSFQFNTSPGLGLENTFATNHLGHFQLTQLLLPELKQHVGSRVVVVASDSHYQQLLTKDMSNREAVINDIANCPAGKFSVNGTYCSSKLCNVLFAAALSHRQAAEASSGGRSGGSAFPVAACSLHPGSMIATDIARQSVIADFFMKYIMSWFTKTVNQGAATTVLCCLLPADQLRGQYFCDCSVKQPSDIAQSEAAQDALWEVSEQLLR